MLMQEGEAAHACYPDAQHASSLRFNTILENDCKDPGQGRTVRQCIMDKRQSGVNTGTHTITHCTDTQQAAHLNPDIDQSLLLDVLAGEGSALLLPLVGDVTGDLEAGAGAGGQMSAMEEW